MYPLKFDNKYVEKIWGGNKLRSYRDNLVEGKIGESWDVSAQNKALSIVKNGKFAGSTLKELVEKYPEKILGTEIDSAEFPLLLKILDSESQLSIQVHPDDEYTANIKGESGKTEAWYIMDAAEDAYLIIGAKNCSREEFKKSVKNNEINKYINKVKVKKGDVFFIKAGLLHAIGPGILLAEIQQSSDTTYRIYDYGRGRKLDLDKGMDAIDFSLNSFRRKGLKIESKDYDYKYLCLNDKFALDLIDIKRIFRSKGKRERFNILTVVEGEGVIKWEDQSLKLNTADSLLIPAYSKDFQIKGELKIVNSYVPDIDQNRKDILSIIE